MGDRVHVTIALDLFVEDAGAMRQAAFDRLRSAWSGEDVFPYESETDVPFDQVVHSVMADGLSADLPGCRRSELEVEVKERSDKIRKRLLATAPMLVARMRANTRAMTRMPSRARPQENRATRRIRRLRSMCSQRRRVRATRHRSLGKRTTGPTTTVDMRVLEGFPRASLGRHTRGIGPPRGGRTRGGGHEWRTSGNTCRS
jgi:hypothetical protein